MLEWAFKINSLAKDDGRPSRKPSLFKLEINDLTMHRWPLLSCNLSFLVIFAILMLSDPCFVRLSLGLKLGYPS